MGGYLRPLPLSLIPLIVYGLGALFTWDFASAAAGGTPTVWDEALFRLSLVSGADYPLRAGDALIVLAGLTLIGTILRAAFAPPTVLANMLAVVSLCLYVVVFLVVGFAATTTFFALLVFAFVDTLGGISLAMVRHRAPRTVIENRPVEPVGQPAAPDPDTAP